jgi:hypothetical protein
MATKSNPQGLDKREWVEIRYHEVRGGSGFIRMYLDELPDWLNRKWESGSAILVEQVIRV